MFAVFDKTLLTDVGKSIVQEHENHADAQEVYKAVVGYYLKPTNALIDPLAYILTSAPSILDLVCGRGLPSFILHWQDQVHMYEKHVFPGKEHFSSGQNHIMLQNAVHPVMEQGAVKNQADQHKMYTGTTLSYEQYCNPLSAACL